MKKNYLLLLALIGLNNFSNAQWQHSNGPYGGWTEYLIQNSNGLFTNDISNGVYFSIDNGANWVQRNNGFNGASVKCLATTGSAVFAGTVFLGMCVTYDDGLHWSQMTNGLPGYPCSINALVFDGTNLLATAYNYSTATGGLYISSDSGLSWQTFSIDTGVTDVGSFQYINGKLFAITNLGLFVSSDHGVTWTLIYTGDVRSITGYYPSLIIQTSQGVYVTSDAGVNWTISLTILACPWQSCLGSYNGNIVAESLGIFYLSADSGKTFTPISNAILQTNNIYVFGNDIFLCTINGIYRSTDGGLTFSESSNGINAARASAIYAEDTFVLCSTYGGIYRSTNNGIDWTNINLKPDPLCFESHNGEIYAGTSFDGVYTSTNQGLSWVPKNSGINHTTILSLAFMGNEIFGNSSSDLYKSDDGGLTWNVLPNTLNASYINFIDEIDSILLVGTTTGIARSDDHGNSWNYTLAGLVNAYESQCKIDSTFFINTNTEIYASFDRGLTWSTLTSPHSNIFIIKIFAFGSNLIVSCNFGIYMSPDKGASWLSYNFGTINKATNTFAANSTTLFTGGQEEFSGVWILDITYAGIPTNPALVNQSNVYPNPFSNEVNISYSLIKNVTVMVDVFTVEGKHVETIIENSYQVAGSHMIKWKNAVPGIYIVRIKSDGETIMKKIVCQ